MPKSGTNSALSPSQPRKRYSAARIAARHVTVGKRYIAGEKIRHLGESAPRYAQVLACDAEVFAPGYPMSLSRPLCGSADPMTRRMMHWISKTLSDSPNGSPRREWLHRLTN